MRTDGDLSPSHKEDHDELIRMMNLLVNSLGPDLPPEVLESEKKTALRKSLFVSAAIVRQPTLRLPLEMFSNGILGTLEHVA